MKFLYLVLIIGISKLDKVEIKSKVGTKDMDKCIDDIVKVVKDGYKLVDYIIKKEYIHALEELAPLFKDIMRIKKDCVEEKKISFNYDLLLNFISCSQTENYKECISQKN